MYVGSCLLSLRFFLSLVVLVLCEFGSLWRCAEGSTKKTSFLEEEQTLSVRLHGQ